MKVLLVDDEREARKILRKIAENFKNQVIEAENGEEGLRMAAEHKPDLVISDVLMPVMDGFSLLRELKSDPALKNIAFIFYSATYTGQADIRLALSMGADHYIVKPSEPESLWAEISKVMERREREKQVRTARPGVAQENEYLRRHSQLMALKLEKTVTKLREALETQKDIAEALLRKNEELEKFFSVSLDLLCVLDDTGNFRLLNPAWERVLGYIKEELLGKKITELIHPEDAGPAREALSKLTKNTDTADFLARHKHKDGSCRMVEWRAAQVGKLIYAAGRDITDRRRCRS